jgi:rifampin ADP-ribosylating transferase
LKINDDNVKGAFPSLYLNIAKCFEDLNDFTNARENYQLALLHVGWLSDSGYGNLIRAGIMNGLERVNQGTI